MSFVLLDDGAVGSMKLWSLWNPGLSRSVCPPTRCLMVPSILLLLILHRCQWQMGCSSIILLRMPTAYCSAGGRHPCTILASAGRSLSGSKVESSWACPACCQKIEQAVLIPKTWSSVPWWRRLNSLRASLVQSRREGRGAIACWGKMSSFIWVSVSLLEMPGMYGCVQRLSDFKIVGRNECYCSKTHFCLWVELI